MGKNISDYTEVQFISFMEEIFAANKNGTPDDVLDDLFRAITEHPDGSDLIYWPEDDAQCTPEGITQTVKKWRVAQGLSGFKQ